MMPETMVSHAPPAPAALTALTLRELREETPQRITDAWCNSLAAQLLDTVEAQQAQGRPHRIIMPDTVLVQPDGACELLSALDEDDAFQPAVEFELKAIAAVLHFAITGESPPGGALLPRGLPAFSDDLLGAIDACLHGDREHRPHSIAAMRARLGFAAPAGDIAAPVAPAPAEVVSEPVSNADELAAAIAGLSAAVGLPAADAAAPVAESPAPAPMPVQPPPPPVSPAPPAATAPARAPRLLLACLAVAALAAGGYGLYQKGRQAGAEAVLAANAPAAPADAAAVLPPPSAEAAPAPAASPVESAPAPAPAPLQASANGEKSPRSDAIRPAPADQPSVTYKLNIKPWGEVYVDGIKRGISPPLKSLTLTGEHTVRIDNPGFASRSVTLRPGKDGLTRIDHVFH